MELDKRMGISGSDKSIYAMRLNVTTDNGRQVPKLGAAARTSGNQTFPAYFTLSIVCRTWHIFLAQISRSSLSLSTMINAPNSHVDYHKVVWDSEWRSGNPRSRWEELTGTELASSRKHYGSHLDNLFCAIGKANSGYYRRVSKSVESTYRNNKTISRQHANGLNG